MSRHAFAQSLIAGLLSHKSTIILLICGITLSIYSGYTTLTGMSHFTAAGDAFPTMALLATIGIQGIMLVSAWIIGDRLKYWGAPGAWITNAAFMVMFLATMACSVFFSYDSIFSNAADQNYRRAFADIEAQTAVTRIINEVPAQLDNELLRAKANIRTSLPWQEYRNSIQKLSALEARFATQLRAMQQAKVDQVELENAKRRKRNEKVEGRLDVIRTERATLAARIANLQRTHAELAKDITVHSDDYRKRDSAYRKAEADVIKEALGVTGEGLTGKEGCGAACRKKREIARELQASSLTALRRRDALQARFQSTGLDIARLQSRLAGLDRQLGNAADQDAGKSNFIQGQSVSKTGPTQDQTSLSFRLSAFDLNPSSQTLSELVTVCVAVQSELRRISPDTTAGTNCEPGLLKDEIAPVDRLLVGQLAFAASCKNQKHLIASQSFAQAIDFGGQCLRQSALPFDTISAYQGRLNTLARESTAAAHSFYQSWKALAVMDTLALFAIAIAIGIDMLTFFTGIFGAQTTFSPMDRVRLPDVREMLTNVPTVDKLSMLAAVKPQRPRESGGFNSMRADAYVGGVAEADLDVPGVRRIIQIAMGRNVKLDEPLIRHAQATYYIHGVLRDELEIQIGNARRPEQSHPKTIDPGSPPSTTPEMLSSRREAQPLQLVHKSTKIDRAS